MKRNTFALICLWMLVLQVQAQVSGHFPGHAKQPVSLSLYQGFQRQQVSDATVDSLGNFSLAFPVDYTGVAFLQFNKAEGIELMINNTARFKVSGTSMFDINSLTCENNPTTNALYTYYKQQIAREKALAGWKYLEKAYNEDPYLKKYNKTAVFSNEIHALENESAAFIESQPEGSYLRWYLPIVSFVRDIPVSVQRYPERIPEHIRAFFNTDFADARFYNSGLFPVLMENYFFMLENSGQTLDSAYVKMNASTDYLVKNLKTKRPDWLPDASSFLFSLFERRSLFPAAEHLSMLMLEQKTVQLTIDLRNRFEGYRTMKKGNRAPDIDFTKAIVAQKEKKDEALNKYLKTYTSLSEMNFKYKLVVFGQGNCPDCTNQLQKIRQMYLDLHSHNVEVLYVSLDSDKANFEPVAAEYPWASYFDYGGWSSKPALDYHVFASPTMYLLGENLEILYKIVSPEHLEAVIRTME